MTELEKTIDIDCFNDEQAVELKEDLLDNPVEYDPSDDLYEEYRERKFLEQEQEEKEERAEDAYREKMESMFEYFTS